MTFLSANTEAWLWLLLDSSLKGALVLVAAFLVTRALRRRSAAVRHAVWAVATLATLALPFLAALLPAWNPNLGGATAIWTGAAAPGAEESGGLAPVMIVRAVLEAPQRTGATPWLLVVWVAGVCAGVLSLLLGTARLAWLFRRAQPLFEPRWMRLTAELGRGLGVTRPVRVFVGANAAMPLTWGVLRPRILLPKGARKWPDQRIRVVLAHELAHIGRNDWLLQILVEITRAFYWFHPLVWLGRNRLREESECACDDAVLNSGVEATDYADHLLSLARTLGSSRTAWSVALAMARPSNLERRFIAMLDPSLRREHVTRGVSLATALATLCLVLPLAALQMLGSGMSGKFFGTIYDASGAVVPNATVIVANPEAKTKDMTTTNGAGVFEFALLPAGPSQVEVLKPGFKRLRATATLEPNQSHYQKFTLQLGEISERVDVVAESPAGARKAKSAEPTTLRAGGTVQASKLVKMARPVYPPAAKAAGIEGSVLLEAVVGKDGSLVSLRVMNSQIDPDLARAAVEAVSQWRYEPTLLNGEPVEVVTNIDVNFRLSTE